MRMSCNGCRILRKGCSESCILRPCLEWIKSEEYQANAIVFLAKFYGRTGLITLIANGPPHSRPALFRSLLYEACGRLLNPVSGSVGLLWSGNWALCQAGVDSILDGSYPNSSNLVDPNEEHRFVQGGIAGELHKVKARGKFKCVGPHNKLKFREHREFIKDLEISSGETQSRGFDIRKTTQDNAIFWTKDVFSSAKGKCSSSSSIASQQPDELDGHNKHKNFHTLNPEVEVFHVKRNEVELELTLGAQQDNPKLEYTNQSVKALYGLENSC